MANNFYELVRVTANRPETRELYILGLYLQNIDTMLWNGFPHIFANYRNLLEGIMNFMIKNDLQLTIKEGTKEEGTKELNISNEEFTKWIRQVCQGEIPWGSLKNSTVFVREDYYKFYHKIDLVESYCKRHNFDISRWDLHNQRKRLNTLVHNISLSKDEESGFRMRFELMKDFHGLIYKDFMKMHTKYTTVGDYIFPSDSELKRIVGLYDSRINSYTF